VAEKYDQIGLGYSTLRRPDPRIANTIKIALGDAENILNVGAGAGSYEPEERSVTAIEPSIEMIKQRPASKARVLRGVAESLPFEDKLFDATMAILTIHHWSNQTLAVQEIRRVTRGPVVFLTFDPLSDWFWLVDYFPALADLDKSQMPRIEKFIEWFDECEVTPLLIPGDCSDGFLAAYWKRPAAYLDPVTRSGISSFSSIGDVSGGVERLKRDLDDGSWTARYGHLLQLDELDCGYRVVIGR